jgi:hypothetical protein
MGGTLLSQTGKIGRPELKNIPVPSATPTHRPIPHYRIIEALLETLSFRHIQVIREEYAVSPDGMKMFGILDLEYGINGVNFSIGIRNANDKSMRLAMTVGYRVLVCDNMAFQGDFVPVLHKHTKNLDLVELVSIGVDKVQRNFIPLKHQIEQWMSWPVGEDQAKLIIYAAFVESRLSISRQLLPVVHRCFFNPEYEAFQAKTLWTLSNAFTSAFKELKPIPQFKAMAKLGSFLEAQSHSMASHPSGVSPIRTLALASRGEESTAN